MEIFRMSNPCVPQSIPAEVLPGASTAKATSFRTGLDASAGAHNEG